MGRKKKGKKVDTITKTARICGLTVQETRKLVADLKGARVTPADLRDLRLPKQPTRRDREYRAALGLTRGQELPKTLGTGGSAGGARGGKGAATRRRTRRYGNIT